MAKFIKHEKAPDGSDVLYFEDVPTPDEQKAKAIELGIDLVGTSMNMESGVIVFPQKMAGKASIKQQARPAKVVIKKISQD